MSTTEAPKRDWNALLLEAADAFERGTSPFERDWLAEHCVTLTECYDLGQQIATCLKGFVRAPAATRHTVLLCAIMEALPHGMQDAAGTAQLLEDVAHGEQIRKRLREA